MVPGERIELPTNGLQNRCSTAELTRQLVGCQAVYQDSAGRCTPWSDSGVVPKKQSPGVASAGASYGVPLWLRSARRAPLPAVGIVPGDELALERLLLSGQRHAHVLPVQFLQLRAAWIG